MNENRFWQTKLAARLHDPGEKALVLMRDRAGHEGGSVKDLRAILPLEDADGRAVERADWWASAADRPQWPDARWTRVSWTSEPFLIHPLSGERIDLSEKGRLKETDVEDIKGRSFGHFRCLAESCGADPKKVLLAFWRFGPEIAEEKDDNRLGALWGQLPADTRVPDHSIWDHLDLTSAFAGAFAGDSEGDAALLALSIGPVQSFIAAARSTSDLWAGSHLLARLAWEVMKPLAERLGPDAVLFPRLRGVPQVDLWLRDECGLQREQFRDAAWNRGGTDANPLFAAALPNRFVAVVPAGQVKELAQTCRDHVRIWLQGKGKEVVDRLLKAAGEQKRDGLYCYEQMRRQLQDFPQVHWAAVPFSLIRPRNREKQTNLDISLLSKSMAPFFGVEAGQSCGFLDKPAWKVLQKEIEWEDGTTFFMPNPGVLYPAVYDLAERVLAAAKSIRAFSQSEEKGWRCSLTGEVEWLTTEPAQLEKSYRRQTDTLWAKIAKEKPAWVKKGEHLGALSTIKRLWPTLFADEVAKALGKDGIGRFVVSTHTMALAHQLDRWLERGGLTGDGLQPAIAKYQPEPVALPQKLMRKYAVNTEALKDAALLPALLERAGEMEEEQDAQQIESLVMKILERGRPADGQKDFSFETYYGLLLMDGDHMGRILSGDDAHAISYFQSFHPVVQEGFREKMVSSHHLQQYGKQKRAVSPNRHLAISGTLNDFALHVVPYVVQQEYLGRLIYAGGDDVLAMLPVADLLPAAQRLRRAWSGHDPDLAGRDGKGLNLKKGYAWLKGRLFRMMGQTATASAGLVVAHHRAPLQRVLRELRETESIAKESGGRNALHLRIIKRSGGALDLTLQWGEPVAQLEKLVVFLADPAVSRRAVYNSLQWLRDLPAPQDGGEMLGRMLAYQFGRQSEGKTVLDAHNIPGLSLSLSEMAAKKEAPLDWLANFLSVAEFLARETRKGVQI